MTDTTKDLLPLDRALNFTLAHVGEKAKEGITINKARALLVRYADLAGYELPPYLSRKDTTYLHKLSAEIDKLDGFSMHKQSSNGGKLPTQAHRIIGRVLGADLNQFVSVVCEPGTASDTIELDDFKALLKSACEDSMSDGWFEMLYGYRGMHLIEELRNQNLVRANEEVIRGWKLPAPEVKVQAAKPETEQKSDPDDDITADFHGLCDRMKRVEAEQGRILDGIMRIESQLEIVNMRLNALDGGANSGLMTSE